MTDAERAERYLSDQSADLARDAQTDAMAAALVREFFFVRREERARVAAWVRSWAAPGETITPAISILRRVADRIERGEHSREEPDATSA